MKEKIEEILRNLVAGIDVNSKALVDEGYVTSITVVELVGELDDAFGIAIDFHSLSKENVSSVEAIVKMVEAYRESSKS